MSKVVVGISTLVVAFSSAFADAEDRKGFFLAGGLGLDTNTFEASYAGSSASESGYRGILTSFKIGGHINPNFALYYQREASFFSDEEGTGVIAGLMGIGGTYYFDRAGGLYIEGGLGLGDLTSEDAGLVGIGGASMIGLGGEINDHLEAGLVMMATSTEESTLDGLEYDTLTLGFKLTLKL